MINNLMIILPFFQITVYSADDEGDIDHAILNALHKGKLAENNVC